MITEKEVKDNKAIGRKEIVFTIKHDGKSQPSRTEIYKLLKAKIKEKNFVIIKIKPRFGKAESELMVHAYADEAKMKYYEPQHYFKRTKIEEEKPAEEEKKEEVSA